MSAATPKALQKRKLSIAQAVDQWESSKRAIEGLTPLLNEAAEVLIAHAQKTGRRTFKDRIAVERTGGQRYLDQAAVVEHLGAAVKDFYKTAKRGWSLKLLD